MKDVKINPKCAPAITKEQYVYSLPSSFSVEYQEHCHDNYSELFAHFLQVVGVLQRSSWYKSNHTVQFNMNHDGKFRGDMPDLVQTVFALTYTRQLVSTKDNLFRIVCKNYKMLSGEPAKKSYIDEVEKEFDKDLKSPPMHVNLRELVETNQQLIDTFLYGALIAHSPNAVKDTQLMDRFKKLCPCKDRIMFIWYLNKTMKDILNTVSKVAVLLQKDFAHWIDKDFVPAPDIFWQENIFKWLSTVEEQKR